MAWDTPNAFVEGGDYGYNMVCGLESKPASGHAPVNAGDEVTEKWNRWPRNHRGPMIDYMANCNGPCDQAKPEDLRFFKIAERGLLSPPGGENPWGYWGTDEFYLTFDTSETEERSTPDKTLAKGPKHKVKIPSNLKAGNYILRTEIIAIFHKGEPEFVQHYPRCSNLAVSGGGSDEPAGVPASSLYTIQDPGLTVRIREKPTSYTVPGPPLYGGGGRGGAGSSNTSAPATGSTMADSSSSQVEVGITSEASSRSSAPSSDESESSTSSSGSSTGSSADTSDNSMSTPSEETGTSSGSSNSPSGGDSGASSVGASSPSGSDQSSGIKPSTVTVTVTAVRDSTLPLSLNLRLPMEAKYSNVDTVPDRLHGK